MHRTVGSGSFIPAAMTTTAWFAFVGTAAAGLLAAAALARAHRALPRWSFAAGMVVLALECLFVGLSASAPYASDARRWLDWRLLMLSFVPFTWLLFSCTYGRAKDRRWLLGNQIALAAAALLPFAYLMVREHAFATAHLAGAAYGFRLSWAGRLLHAVVLVASVFTVVNLERTFRASVGTVRWRIKYMLLGVGILFAVRIYTTSQVLVFRGIDPALDSINAAALILASVLIARGLLRAGHFELDVYPSGSVLQNSLTVLVAGIYLVVVGLGAKLVSFIGGDAAFGLKAFVVLIAIIALALVLQSDRARLQARQLVSRHFQRPLHDSGAVWRKVTEATASKVEPDELCSALTKLVANVLQALSVRLWLANDAKDTLVMKASTAGAPTGSAGLIHPAAEILTHFKQHPLTVDLDSASDAWCARIRAAHATQFPNGGHRICAPLIARGDVLGIFTIGDRVGGVPFTLQDLALLKCIAEHSAASLLNMQLSQQLLQAKQLEAFQSMAAFFVHDLKNAASTLNLTLQNLPVHFDDPEFRADALRGIGKTADHINALINRLTALRHELTLQPTITDLNEVVTQALANFGAGAPATVVTDMHPLPPLRLDREQVQKVVLNLVLNAAEAVSRGGRICVSTGQQAGSVVLTVDDNGCGMSEDFIARSLFRPFQTTKKTGIGIGMFQSKMIVDAHGGRINVTSKPGVGTRFQVYFPIPTTARG